MPIPLLLDTDIGDDVDDVFALLLAALSPNLDLIGVTTVYGDARERARLARHTLDAAGKPHVPVAVGHGMTLTGRDPLARGEGGTSMASARQYIDTLDPAAWHALDARLDQRHAVDFLIEMILAAPEPPVVAAIGPLTNVAAAFQRAPETTRRIYRLVLMGGRLGQDAERGEHNFNSDAAATAAVLAGGAPLWIGTYEVTCQARIGEAELPRLRAGTPPCRAAAEQLVAYLRRGSRTATSMYDPLSLTLAYSDRFLATRPVALRCRTEDRLAVLTVDESAGPNAHVSADLDAPAFVEHLLTTIGA